MLKQGNEAGRGKRRKITIRSPESIARSVYEERPPPSPCRDKGRADKRCHCPVHCDGEYNGVRAKRRIASDRGRTGDKQGS